MKKQKRRTKFNLFLILIIILITIYIAITLSYSKGNIYKGEIHQIPESSIEFLYDLTYEDNQGNIIHEQEIFDKIFEIIDNAENFIILDMFLFKESEKQVYRNLANETTEHLINKKNKNPDIPIYLITDYINNINHNNQNLKKLKEQGIIIIYSAPHKIKDFDKETPLNYFLKANRKRLNHRKLIIADNQDKIVSLITSANPHDESSAHSNVAFYIKEKIWKDIYDFEKKENKLSNNQFNKFFNNLSESQEGNISIQFLADNALVSSIEKEIENTQKGESIDIMMFYLSYDKIIDKLIQASERGVNIRIILDQSIDAFGKKKNGMPNKPVAEILNKKSKGNIQIRWYKTHGEQFHIKTTIFNKQDNQSIIFLGGSHLVNYDTINYNSQSDVKLIADSKTEIIQKINTLFNRIWFNKQGTYTTDYEEFRDTSAIKQIVHRARALFRLP
ncbi:hypothetical protein HOD75_01660 [archaeon]|jgi:cardiolipin synthase A/B|nr:hypothetical protein [archaeon]MBT4241584.1 hypothetical protein [archaeon]MBT4417979.1 hypothetical protein [archaeon]